MDGPWDIDPDEEEAMIAEQAEHDAAAADAAATEYEANEKNFLFEELWALGIK